MVVGPNGESAGGDGGAAGKARLISAIGECQCTRIGFIQVECTAAQRTAECECAANGGTDVGIPCESDSPTQGTGAADQVQSAVVRADIFSRAADGEGFTYAQAGRHTH